MTEEGVRFWLEVAFWTLLVGGILNGERLIRKHDRQQQEQDQP